RKADGSLDRLRLKVVADGHKFTLDHQLGTAQITTKNALSRSSQRFVDAATRDLGLLHAAIRQRALASGTVTPTNQCASSLAGSILAPCIGAGLSQGASLSLLAQTAAFANASGASCVGIITAPSRPISAAGLPFGGNINAILPGSACDDDPDPDDCEADFATF